MSELIIKIRLMFLLHLKRLGFNYIFQVSNEINDGDNFLICEKDVRRFENDIDEIRCYLDSYDNPEYLVDEMYADFEFNAGKYILRNLYDFMAFDILPNKVNINSFYICIDDEIEKITKGELENVSIT